MVSRSPVDDSAIRESAAAIVSRLGARLIEVSRSIQRVVVRSQRPATPVVNLRVATAIHGSRKALEVIERDGVTVFEGVPTMYSALPVWLRSGRDEIR